MMKHLKRPTFRTAGLLLLFGLLVGLVGCDASTDTSTTVGGASRIVSPEDPIAVTATVGMVADLVRNVGGDRVAVKQICGSGVDPHLYKVTRDDVQLMRSADLVFYSGLMLEGKMSDTLVKEARTRPVIPVTEAIEESMLLEPDDFAGHYDPHVWMDVSAWSQCVEIVASELGKFDPQGQEVYQANAKAYQEQLTKLHEYGKERIASIPQASRVLVTSHDAFNYFGRAYGLEVLGVQGISTESEAGLQRINELVKLLVDRNVRSVFIESSVSSANIEALVEGARSKGHEVKIGEKELFSDAMGEDGTYEGTYIGMLDHNITIVTRGLGGEAPAEGMNGKLMQ
jgi:manganese/zinc/iron transport system substrate-binding protein